MPRKYTEARKVSNRKWDAQNLDRISISLPKGRRDEIKAHADSRGESMNAFIGRAIEHAMRFGTDADALKRGLDYLRGVQTNDALVSEIYQARLIMTDTTWCNVAYNPQLYKTAAEKKAIADALIDSADAIHDLFYKLAERIRNE